MSVDDIKDLEFDETVEIKKMGLDKTLRHKAKGKVKGIDLWEKRVRVELDEFNCLWFPPRLIKRLNLENEDR